MKYVVRSGIRFLIYKTVLEKNSFKVSSLALTFIRVYRPLKCKGLPFYAYLTSSPQTLTKTLVNSQVIHTIETSACNKGALDDNIKILRHR